jgi:hypothetical protein
MTEFHTEVLSPPPGESLLIPLMWRLFHTLMEWDARVLDTLMPYKGETTLLGALFIIILTYYVRKRYCCLL